MIVFPNAKINIGLFITEKRADGYHNLETIFYPVTTSKDVLEIIECNDAESLLNTSGLSIAGDDQNNLVWRAYHLLKNKFPTKVKALEIHLHKSIPMGGGLGGGSSNGAFMLRLMNDFFQLELNTQQLIDFAASLGSDCPFFINNKPCFATGRGEQMTPINLDLSAYEIKLATSSIHCSTAEAFKGITPQKPSFDLQQLSQLPIENWKDVVYNDFEKNIFKLYPELQKTKNDFYEAGAVYAAMTGTGSTIYGIFKK